MTWTLENSRNDEASKIRWELVPYMHGRSYDLGCGPYKVFPHFIGVDNGHHWGNRGIDFPVKTCEVLQELASQSADCVFSSHLLEHIEDYKAALKEWWRLVKPGGFLCLYLPHKDFYPNIGHEYANRDHKHDFYPQDIIEAMEAVGGWDLVQNEERNDSDEYSFFQVYKKVGGGKKLHGWKEPKPSKTCAVVRYGAIGDMIQTSSILPALKSDGYHITLYCQSGAGYESVREDPNIDRFIIQGKDQVPNQFLAEFWDYTKKKYDKWVNLSESVEGTLLAIPGRVNHEWPNQVRAKFLDRNYLEWTHELAEVSPPYQPKFYSTLDEKAWARKTAQRWGRKNILWSLSGSSGHKTWPHLDTIIARLMLSYTDVHVALVGDELCKLLETGWEKEPRVHCLSGEWSIRQSMAFAEASDLIIGTETGLLNAAGGMDVPKIVTLSHSSQEMLTKHWKNAIPLEQPQGVGCPKAPCRQLHYSWDYCPQHKETGTAMCQYHIDPEMMWEAVVSILGEPQRMVA